jgi:hypothetical protein
MAANVAGSTVNTFVELAVDQFRRRCQWTSQTGGLEEDAMKLAQRNNPVCRHPCQLQSSWDLFPGTGSAPIS